VDITYIDYVQGMDNEHINQGDADMTIYTGIPSNMTYNQAKNAANSTNQNIIFAGEAGNGCRFEVYFCPQRNRQIWTTVTANGTRIV